MSRHFYAQGIRGKYNKTYGYYNMELKVYKISPIGKAMVLLFTDDYTSAANPGVKQMALNGLASRDYIPLKYMGMDYYEQKNIIVHEIL